MNAWFCDLHIHIGRTGEGNPVKITASRDLTFHNIVEECLLRKGLDVAAIVDCASPGVQRDIKDLIDRGDLLEQGDGGFLHKRRLVVILGAEVETREDSGALSHHIAYFPYLRQMREFTSIMSRYITNIELSSQRSTLAARELLAVVKSVGGTMIPAHAFTPHRSIYGSVARRLSEVLGDEGAEIPAVELGLSADTYLADRIEELQNMSFLSNSDAHSLARIGREYNIIEMERCTFRELMLALHRRAGRRIIANYGMDPRLGRYHRSFCARCGRVAKDPPPVLSCPECTGKEERFVRGVLDRVEEIADFASTRSPDHRPPYCYQVPLHFVPGVSPEVLRRLIAELGSEMAVLHKATRAQLVRVVGPEVAADILRAREGTLRLDSGGGGHYGRVRGEEPSAEQLTMNFE